MLKIFVRIWFLVFLPLAFLLFATTYNPLNLLNEWLIYERITDSYKGTFYLVEKELANIPESEWPDQFGRIRAEFGHDLRLLSSGDEIPNDRPLEELETGDFWLFEDDNESDVIVKRVGTRDWFIYMLLEESEDQLTLNQSQGTLNLVIRHFEGIPQNRWNTVMEELRPHFGFDFTLLNVNDLNLSKLKLAQLRDIGRTWRTTEDQNTMLYQVMPGYLDKTNPLILVVGPIPLPGSSIAVIVGISLIFVGGISLGIWLFVFPLWRDLSKLNKTAEKFGAGYLKERALVSKRSVINKLGGSFNHMAEQIESMIIGQRDLTNAIAHDLRTPLSRLSFAFEMLQSDETTAEEKKRYERSIASGIDTLDHLIQQILTLSRYSRAMDISNFKQCRFAKLLSDELSQCADESPLASFEFFVSPDLSDESMLIDQRALLRAVNNLVSNAERYAKTTLKVSFFKELEDYVLWVEDDGPGVPDAESETIFLAFKQLDNAQREISKEHGLGLAIVRQIAHWHNGSATVTRSQLGGAKFELKWPINRGESSA